MSEGKKKVCIIRSNPVNPDSRVEKEALSLKRVGYDVHILAWDREKNSKKETIEYIQIADTKIPITRLGYFATYGEGFKNLRAYLLFQFHMRKWLKQNDFDVVHACDFDTAFFSRNIVKKKKEKFVFDIFDFLYDKPHGFMQRCVKKAQYKIINDADATIICTEERTKQIKGSHPKKLIVIHNTPSLLQAQDGYAQQICSDKIKVVYVGILQDYRLLKEVTEVISKLQDVDFYVGGFGKYEEYFSTMDAQYDNIHFYGRLSYADTLALEKECDIMLAIYDPAIDNHIYAAPNKFYESLMLGKPIIMARGTGMSSVVQKNDIGAIIDFSEDGFVSGIKELIGRKKEWPEMKKRMNKIYEEQYSWKKMEDRLCSLYEEL